MFITKSQLQKNLERLDEYTHRLEKLIPHLAVALNDGHKFLWDLPDDQLTEVLEYLIESERIVEVFTKHELTASHLNAMLDSDQAIIGRGREFEIAEDGKVTLEPVVVEEVISQPELQDIIEVPET